MNNLYLIERLVEVQMQEVQREVEQARLLKEADLSEPGWLARAGRTIRNLLAMHAKRRQRNDSVGCRSYQAQSDKLAH